MFFELPGPVFGICYQFGNCSALICQYLCSAIAVFLREQSFCYCPQFLHNPLHIYISSFILEFQSRKVCWFFLNAIDSFFRTRSAHWRQSSFLSQCCWLLFLVCILFSRQHFTMCPKLSRTLYEAQINVEFPITLPQSPGCRNSGCCTTMPGATLLTANISSLFLFL